MSLKLFIQFKVSIPINEASNKSHFIKTVQLPSHNLKYLEKLECRYCVLCRNRYKVILYTILLPNGSTSSSATKVTSAEHFYLLSIFKKLCPLPKVTNATGLALSSGKEISSITLHYTKHDHIKSCCPPPLKQKQLTKMQHDVHNITCDWLNVTFFDRQKFDFFFFSRASLWNGSPNHKCSLSSSWCQVDQSLLGSVSDILQHEDSLDGLWE